MSHATVGVATPAGTPCVTQVSRDLNVLEILPCQHPRPFTVPWNNQGELKNGTSQPAHSSEGGSLPPTYVVGCQPADVGEGMGLSPAVAAAVDGAVVLVHDLLAERLGHPTPDRPERTRKDQP